MRIRELTIAAACSCFVFAGISARAEGPGLGQTFDPATLPFYLTHVMPDGSGLPAGRGTVAEGGEIYATTCAHCHGATGSEGPVVRLHGVGLRPSLTHWPSAPTFFEYTRRSMPFHAPKSLSDDETYAVLAWLFHQIGVIPENAVLDAATLAAIEMPNRDNMINVWDLQGETPW